MTTIANYERKGKLHPRRTYRPDSRGVDRNVAVYDPSELTSLPRAPQAAPAVREPGEIAARAFELFDQGMTPREAVIELRETPERISGLRENWLDLGGAGLTITQSTKAALEQLVGPFSDVSDLLALIEKLIKQ